MLRLNLPDPKLGSVLEEEYVEVDTVDQCKEFILYNKELKDESERKLIQKERDLLTREDLIRKDVVNINCLKGKKINKNIIFSLQRLVLLKDRSTQFLLLLYWRILWMLRKRILILKDKLCVKKCNPK